MFFFIIQSFIFPGIIVIIGKKKGQLPLLQKISLFFYLKKVVKFIITNNRTDIINMLIAKDLFFNNIANFSLQNCIMSH